MNCKCGLSNVAKDYLNTFYSILNTMIDGMTSAELSDSISHNFIVQMIPHHKGAIALSQNTLCYDICPELVPILDAIITSQEKGVKQMERLLHSIGC